MPKICYIETHCSGAIKSHGFLILFLEKVWQDAFYFATWIFGYTVDEEDNCKTILLYFVEIVSLTAFEVCLLLILNKDCCCVRCTWIDRIVTMIRNQIVCDYLKY